MDLLKILLLVCCMPSFYALRKLYKRRDVNIFDFLMLWHTVYFCVVPFTSSKSQFEILFSSKVDVTTTILYTGTVFVFLLCMLFINIYWTKHKGHKISVINICLYLRQMKLVTVSNKTLALLIINLIVAFTWYIPQISYVSAISEDIEGTVSQVAVFYGNIYCLCLITMCMISVQQWVKFHKLNKTLLMLSVAYVVSLMLMPRREMTSYILFVIFITYALKPTLFTMKRIMYCSLLMFFVFKVYFPFYNVMRFVSVTDTGSNAVENVINLFEATIDNYDEGIEHAQELTDGRTLGLYFALYSLVKYDNEPSFGGLTLKAADHALPKIINPGKGRGTEGELERKAHASVDQADSVLLHSYGECGAFLGGLFAVMLFVAVILVYNLYVKFADNILGTGNIAGVFVAFRLFQMAYNLESKVDGYIAGLISFIPLLLILIAISKVKIITIGKV